MKLFNSIKCRRASVRSQKKFSKTIHQFESNCETTIWTEHHFIYSIQKTKQFEFNLKRDHSHKFGSFEMFSYIFRLLLTFVLHSQNTWWCFVLYYIACESRVSRRKKIDEIVSKCFISCSGEREKSKRYAVWSNGKVMRFRLRNAFVAFFTTGKYLFCIFKYSERGSERTWEVKKNRTMKYGITWKSIQNSWCSKPLRSILQLEFTFFFPRSTVCKCFFFWVKR